MEYNEAAKLGQKLAEENSTVTETVVEKVVPVPEEVPHAPEPGERKPIVKK